MPSKPKPAHAVHPPAVHPPAVHPFDQRHGTDTSGLLEGPVIQRGTTAKLEELTAYYGIAPSILEGLLDIWLQRTEPAAPIERTVFLDVGAGKGRAMLLASQLPFLRVEGVELSPALVAIAEQNIALWLADESANPLSPIVLHHADATRITLPPEPTLAFLFHPFEAPVLQRFLRHVERSVTAQPRAFDLVYANAEHNSLLDSHPAFERLWLGRVPMSAADHVADLAEIAQQSEYGSTGDELCAIFRYRGRNSSR
jgi:SAM-dependent methyltransferase